MSTKIFTSAQRAERCVLSLEQAVYHACKKERGALGKIADIYGVNYNTLALQVNPNRDCHTLAPETIELVLEHTQSSLIMDAICCAHGAAGWFLLPDPDTQGDEMMDLALLGQKFADLNSTAIDAYADKIIKPDENARIQRDCQALIRHIHGISESYKRNMERHNDR